MNKKQTFLFIVAGLSWALSFGAQAQCFGGPQFSLYAGAQYLQGPLVANSAFYQPQAYYRAGSNMQLGQPPLFGGGLCSPGMMGPQLPQFHHGLTMPAFPWASMIPQMLGGLGEIANGFMNKDNDSTPLSYRDYLVKREIDQTLASGERPAASAPATSLETDGIFRELPMSNSAGTLGLIAPARNDELLPGEIPLETEEEKQARLAGDEESGNVTETTPTDTAPEVVSVSPTLTIPDADGTDGADAPIVSTTTDPEIPIRAVDGLTTPATDEAPVLPLEDAAQPEVTTEISGFPPVPVNPDEAGREDISDSDLPVYGPVLPAEMPIIVPGAEDTPIVVEAPPVLETPTLTETIVDVNTTLEELPGLGLSPIDPCSVLRNTDPQKNHPIVNGALRTMATFYQSCEVLDIVLNANTPIPPVSVDVFEQENKINKRRLTAENKEQYIAHHPYLSRLQALQKENKYPGPQCRNILDQPPIFSLGAKPEIRHNQNQIEINLFNNQTQKCQTSNIECDSIPVSAIDCSGFVQASLFASGLKVTKDQRDRRDLGTSGFLAAAHDPKTCIKPAHFDKTDSGVTSIQPGDMIVGHDHHMYIIQSVGADPLGINRALATGKCQDITIDQFDFQLIQSGAGRSLGVAQMDAKFPAQSQILLSRLLFEAQKTCQEVQQKKSISKAVVQTSRRTEFMVIRHKGSDDPECKIAPEKIKIEGEACIENCPQLEARS